MSQISGKLIIRPQSASLIHDSNVYAPMSLYARITSGDLSQDTAVAYRVGKNSKWDDSFSFPIAIGNVELKCSLFDKNAITEDDLLGEAIISLNCESFAKQRTETFTLKNGKSTIGKVSLVIQFVSDD